jgi:putative ABC transport system permease protein
MLTFSRFTEYLSMSWTAVKTHRMRSMLTTLGILIGVTTIITIWTTIEGLNKYVYDQLSRIGSSVVYVEKYPWIIKNDFWRYRNRKNITYKEYEAIKKNCRTCNYVSPEVFSVKRVSRRDEKFDNIFVLGVTEVYDKISNIFPEYGRFITATDVRSRRPVCLLGADLAQKLFKEQNPIRQRIKINGNKYTVIGVLEKQGSAFGMSRDEFVIVPISTFRKVYGGRRGLRISVMTDNSEKLDDMKDELRGILRKVRKVKPSDADDFAINQQDQLTQAYAGLTTTLFAIIFIIGGISLVVGGIGIMNIMLVSVTERTKEIGIRKAIGAKRKNILSQFLIEAVLISSLGGFIGLILGYFAGSAILAQMDLSIGVSITSISIGFGFSTTVGILAGIYPASKASKLSPIDALRYE